MSIIVVLPVLLALAIVAECGVVSGGVNTVLTPTNTRYSSVYGLSNLGHGQLATVEHPALILGQISSGQYSHLGSAVGITAGQHSSGLVITSDQPMLGSGLASTSGSGLGVTSGITSVVSTGFGSNSESNLIGTGLGPVVGSLGIGNVVDGGTTISQQVRHIPIGVPQPIPVVVTHPVAVPFAVAKPVVVPRPVPIEVPHGVPVAVPRPVPVAVPRPVPVHHPVYVKVPKPILVSVPKAVIVPDRLANDHRMYKLKTIRGGSRESHVLIIPGGLRGGLSDFLSGGLSNGYRGNYASGHSYYIRGSIGGHYSGSGRFSNVGTYDHHHHNHESSKVYGG